MDYLVKQRLTVAAGGVTTVNLANKSNYFRVVNTGATSLYCTVKGMPTNRTYDFKVLGGTARMYCEEKSYNQFFVYNPTTSDIEIILYTFKAAFEPTVMALCDAMFDDAETKEINVEITGFTDSLPTGSNKIGKVDVSNQIDYTSKLDTIEAAVAELISANMYHSNVGAWDGNNVSNTSIINDSGKCNILMLTNDGDNDISFTFGLNSEMTSDFILKAGETITDFKINGYAAISGTNYSYRIIVAYV